jgi:Heparinase II/III-like protein/Heparinase II/III N-terminus
VIARIARTLACRFGMIPDILSVGLGRNRVSSEEVISLRDASDGMVRFIFDQDEQDSLAQQFRQDYPAVADQVIEQADQICRHEFDLLGSGKQSLGAVINWHADLMTKHQWRSLPSALLLPQIGDDSTDIKRVWDLSRCQHFAVLGQAYALTGDEKYAREWVAQMVDWDATNPPLVGPNWMVTMEAAIRIVNWVWGYSFMAHSEGFDDNAHMVFDKNVLSHGRFIMRHLEKYGNHRFSNFVGLVVLGSLFRNRFEETGQWYEVGLKGFCEEVAKQVHQDGCHFEGSIPYHRLVLEMAATVWLLLDRNDLSLPAETRAAIERMFSFTAAYTRLCRHAPQVGDADDGRLQALTETDMRDHSYLLSLGAVLTGKGEFKVAQAPHAEAFWLLGEKGLAEYSDLPVASGKHESVGFEKSGCYVLNSDRMCAFVSCRQQHTADHGAHAHNDHLSFTLTVDGLDFIVDAGTFTYTANLTERNSFRSSRAHNTIIIDGQEINPFNDSDPFRLKDNAECRVTEWSVEEGRDVLCASHSGYARLGAMVQRKLVLDKGEETLAISDQITGNEMHKIEWRFLFAPKVEVRLEDNCVTASRDSAALQLKFKQKEKVNARIESAWYSPSYGVRKEARRLTVTRACKLPAHMDIAVSLAEVRGGNP